MGRMVAGRMRPDLEPLEDKDYASKLYVQFALMTEMRKGLTAASVKQFTVSMKEKN
jgi:hypothetical protein